MEPFAIPELTRGLRYFALPSTVGSDHATFFGPLLAARRRAHEAGAWPTRIAAFDGAELSQSWTAMLHGLASARFPRPGPDARALLAELEECSVAVYAAVDRLATAADAVRRADGDGLRRAHWADWIAAAQALFHAADEAWARALPVLADSRGARGRWWRRRTRPQPD